jgi:SAM-dependent methyltransferase
VRPGAELRDGSAAAPVAEDLKPADWDGLLDAAANVMVTSRRELLRLVLAAVAVSWGLALVAALNLSQAQPATGYQPSVGQEGKDVVWVPTSNALVDKMLDLAAVTASDFLVDLGSGDGRTVIAAAKRGAKALGIEYNPELVELSRRNAAKEGIADRAAFEEGDVFETDFSKATVITLFLLQELNLRLRPKILDMNPGVRVVSNTFDMDDWMPEQRIRISEGCTRYCTAFFWIVPAKLEGTWKMPRGELALKQTYQMLSGTMKVGNASAVIKAGKVTGQRVTFSVGNIIYTGLVNGNTIEGVSKSATGETQWRATRAD